MNVSTAATQIFGFLPYIALLGAVLPTILI
jgi:hypothetical protein